MTNWQHYVALGLLILQAVLAAAIVADPGSLGIPPIVLAWAAIVNVAVGVALNQLKAVGKPG